MKKKNQTTKIVLISILIIAIIFIFNIGNIKLAILGQEKNWLIYDKTCNTDQDCKEFFLSEGATEEILSEIPYRCENNFCQLYIVDKEVVGVISK